MATDFENIKSGFAIYLQDWYNAISDDTPSLTIFKSRGFSHCVQWVKDRMVDDVEAMLQSYRKNDNEGAINNNSLFPIILMAMDKNYDPTEGGFGGRQVWRQMICIEDVPGASVYGYRQAMGNLKLQMAIISNEVSTARSLASQLTLFLGDFGSNRRFTYDYKFGQYTIQMPVIIETPDVSVVHLPNEQTNLTLMAVDIQLKVTVPYFDAPGIDDPNDGSSNVPPGYPVVSEIVTVDNVALLSADVTEDQILFGSKGDF